MSEATTPASTLPIAGVLATWASSKPCIRPRISVRGAGEEDRRAEDRAVLVGEAGDREHRDAEPERRREPEARDRDAPEDDRAPRPRRPGGAPAPIQPEVSAATSAPTAGARVEQADDAGARVEVVRRDGREERLRHAEDHRVRVEHEGPEDHALADEEAQPSRSDSSVCWAIALLRRRRRDQRARRAATARTSTTSIAYVAPTPAAAISRPPSAGPDDRRRCSSRSTAAPAMPRAAPRGTRPGIIARRAGAPSAQSEVADRRQHVQRPDLRIAARTR